MSQQKEFGENSGFVREQYELYCVDPGLVSAEWRDYFDSETHTFNGKSATQNGTQAPLAYVPPNLELSIKAAKLVEAYRARGYFLAKYNPLEHRDMQHEMPEDLLVESFGLTQQDMGTSFYYKDGGFTSNSMQELLGQLRQVYTGTIGFDYWHLSKKEERDWLIERIESRPASLLSARAKKNILRKLVSAETFESQIHKNFIGHKRFSLEGGDCLIPLLDVLVATAAERGVKEVVMGMSHRGRLNVLANTFHKPIRDILAEFEDRSLASSIGAGDVKYHMGYQGAYDLFETEGGRRVKLSLASNPSHLEFVGAVVEGMVRAKQDLHYGRDRQVVLPLVLHGDAAFAGQGVVYETLNFSRVKPYHTGGTIHVVVNNQIGFTTTPEESRSSPFCSDLVKGIEAPVFHVNAEDPEAACWAASLAVEFRARFKRDVIIDLYCYRKFGHNEGDDPSFTQPLMYEEIGNKRLPWEDYGDKLIAEGVVTQAELSEMVESAREHFASEYEAQKKSPPPAEACAMHGRLRIPTPETGVAREQLHVVANSLIKLPSDFEIHPKLKRILEKRTQTLVEGEGLDWGFCEALAFGSLAMQGINVRLSGQDCGRGTFSQRHLLLDDYKSRRIYIPFSSLPGGGKFEVYNSTLSEAGVMGFEYGYASVATDSLVMWEGQFGDFGNGAQVIIDQFLTSSEAKWSELCGLVLLLPHGYEGQGPEHSSARLERYLHLCGEGNIVVCYPSCASQHFHLLRRQGVMKMKRPLVVMTPKSLLRSADASAHILELTNGQFKTIIEDEFGEEPEHVVFLSGKIFYDVKKGLEEAGIRNVKIIRIEQLYPFPQFELKKALRDIEAETYTWVQEEPQNMGSWFYMDPMFRSKLGINLYYAGRAASASTASGSMSRHLSEQKKIISDLIEIVK